jgi:CRP/FNR family cyclic AMP-dependent transcriptional regulator
MMATPRSLTTATLSAPNPPVAPTSTQSQRVPSPGLRCEGSRTSHVELLSQVDLFAALTPPEVEVLAAACRLRRFKPGQVLFHEGDPGHALYLIQSGLVKVVRIAPDGQETILHVAGCGECLGEMALLDEEPRSATTEALGEVEALMLDREAFLALLERQPAAARAVMAELARRVRRLNEQVQDSTLLDVPGRIAKTLLGLAEQHGQVAPQGIRIPLPLSREEFAQLVGTARPTVSKELMRFREQGILSVDREGFTLHQPERLRKRAYGEAMWPARSGAPFAAPSPR